VWIHIIYRSLPHSNWFPISFSSTLPSTLVPSNDLRNRTLHIRLFKIVKPSTTKPGKWLLKANITGQSILPDASGGVSVSFTPGKCDNGSSSLSPPPLPLDVMAWKASDCGITLKGMRLVCKTIDSRIFFSITPGGDQLVVGAKATNRSSLLLDMLAMNSSSYTVHIKLPSQGTEGNTRYCGDASPCTSHRDRRVLCGM